jgi:hypothetical protein
MSWMERAPPWDPRPSSQPACRTAPTSSLPVCWEDFLFTPPVHSLWSGACFVLPMEALTTSRHVLVHAPCAQAKPGHGPGDDQCPAWGQKRRFLSSKTFPPGTLL